MNPSTWYVCGACGQAVPCEHLDVIPTPLGRAIGMKRNELTPRWDEPARPTHLLLYDLNGNLRRWQDVSEEGGSDG